MKDTLFSLNGCADEGNSNRNGQPAKEAGNCLRGCGTDNSIPPPRSPKARDRGHPQLDNSRHETMATRRVHAIPSNVHSSNCGEFGPGYKALLNLLSGHALSAARFIMPELRPCSSNSEHFGESLACVGVEVGGKIAFAGLLGNSRFPLGMTDRKAKATAIAKATADSLRE